MKTLARTCDLCGRGYLRGHQISHSNIKTIKRQMVNLQTKTIDGVRKKICARCLRTLKKKTNK
jgi:ribosomal protein L28